MQDLWYKKERLGEGRDRLGLHGDATAGFGALGLPGGGEHARETAEGARALTLLGVGRGAAEAGAVALAAGSGVPAWGHGSESWWSLDWSWRWGSDGRRSGSAGTGVEGDGSGWGGGSGGSSGSGGVGAVDLDGDFLEDVEGLFGGGVDGEDHALAAVGAGALLAVPPGWLLLGYGVLPGGGRDDRVVGVGEEARVEFGTGFLDAWVVESGLRHGVVLLVEDKVHNVADVGLDVLWGVDKTGVASYDDLGFC